MSPAERLDISCGFAPDARTPEHIELAESLGYSRAWCYDSPAFYNDVWMTLGLAAARTSRIGLGSAVLVPSLRHVTVTAAAVATLDALAPGRVAVTIGTGYSGRIVVGKPPLRWSEVTDYVRALRTLLDGGDAESDGTVLRLQLGGGSTTPRPVAVPLLIAADGPRGQAIARELGDGVFIMQQPREPVLPELPWRCTFALGTVLDPGEVWNSPRARAATEAAAAANYHLLYQAAGNAVDRLPGGRRWRESIESRPTSVRHLEVHAGHLVAPNRHDRLAMDDAFADSAALSTFALPPSALTVEAWHTRLDRLADMGITEVAFQPMGPDLERELTTFATMSGLTRPKCLESDFPDAERQ
jgi:5,10-methylenetetrahydromethanopterin reductase